MSDQFIRSELILGTENIQKLHHFHVAVFGIGGVGGFVVEALVRCGIQHIDLIDNDTVSISNINRQIIATHSTVGKYKVDVMKNRILDINPNSKVNCFKCFYLEDTKNLFDFKNYDYVVDAIDTVSGKIQLILQAKEAGTRIISCLGTGNKLDPTKLQISDISKTSICPLARVMRHECKKRGISDLKVLYSTEIPCTPDYEILPESEKKSEKPVPGSVSFVPSAAGLIIASEVVKDLLSL